MDDVRLANYFAGTDSGPFEMWRADVVTASALKILVGTPIMLSSKTLLKIQIKHSDIKYPDYKSIPKILDKGYIIFDYQRNAMVVCYISPDKNNVSGYKVCLKKTKSGSIFISTFHHLKLTEIKRLRKKAIRDRRLLRDVESEIAQRL